MGASDSKLEWLKERLEEEEAPMDDRAADEELLSDNEEEEGKEGCGPAASRGVRRGMDDGM